MRRLKLADNIAWILLFVLAGLVLHAPITVWLVSQGAPVGVKAWKEVLLVIAGLLMLFDTARQSKYRVLSNDRVLWVIGGYVLLHAVSILASPPSLYAILVGLMIDLRYVVYFATVYIFLRLYPSYRQSFLRVGVLGASVVVGVVLLQLFAPHDVLKYIGYSDVTIKPYILLDENPDYVRLNSTMRGPNPLGAYAMMVLLGVVAYGVATGRALRKSSEWALPGFLAAGGVVALWASYSRSAWLGFAAGLGVLVVVRYGRNFGVRQIVAVVLLIASISLVGYAVRDTDAFKNLVLHDNPTTGAAYTSDQGHKDSLMLGVDRMLQQPFGAGVGSTGSASLATDKPFIIENQYLMVAHEVGWLGLVLFMAIWVWVLWRLWKNRGHWLTNTMLASGVGLMAISFTWPVLVDDPVSMIWWGLAATALALQVTTKGKKRGTTTNKKAA